MRIEWRIRWRGDERTVYWENGTLGGDEAAASAFGRFMVSNAPTTDAPAEERLRDPALVRAMMAEFADVILETKYE